MKYHIGKTIIKGVEYRKCRNCREIKVLNENNFLKRNTENGWRGFCRICYNAKARIKQESTQAEKLTSKKSRDKYKKEKPLECLLKYSKGNSKKCRREWDLKLEDLQKLWIKQDGKCFYTGRTMLFEIGYPESVSLDRVDSTKGYINANIVLCQNKVNVMKNNASVEELLLFCKDVLENFKIIK